MIAARLRLHSRRIGTTIVHVALAVLGITLLALVYPAEVDARTPPRGEGTSPARAGTPSATAASTSPDTRPGHGPGEAGNDDPFARRGWHLELGGHAALETWNYNGSHEEVYGQRVGLTYGLGKGVTLIAGSPLYYVDQRGVDGFLLGLTFGVRGRIYRRGRMSLFLESEVGISKADTLVPPRGTRFNYLVLGGAGATFRLTRGVHMLTGLKWLHLSNNGLAGRDRNPDIEAVGPHAAVLIAF